MGGTNVKCQLKFRWAICQFSVKFLATCHDQLSVNWLLILTMQVNYFFVTQNLAKKAHNGKSKINLKN